MSRRKLLSEKEFDAAKAAVGSGVEPTKAKVIEYLCHYANVSSTSLVRMLRDAEREFKAKASDAVAFDLHRFRIVLAVREVGEHW